MANTTIKITQLPSIGNGLSASTILPVVNTSGTAVTEKVTVGAVANYVLTQAGNTLSPAFLSTIAYSVSNASQPNITSVGTLSVDTLKISGGIVGYYLQTDGSGNLAWAPGGGGNGAVGGINTQVQFNDAGNFSGNTGFTFNKTTGVFSSPFLAGNGNGLSNIQGANVSGTVGNANLSQYLDVSDVNNNFSYHVVLSAGSGDKSLHIDADDNLQYNPADGTLTATRVDATYVLADLQYSNGYPAANVTGLGNIATANFDGNSSNVLYGNGVFDSVSSPFNQDLNTTDNVTFANITSTDAIRFSNSSNIVGALGYAPTYVSIEGYGSNTVNITANDIYTWTFGDTGNLTLPGNTFSVNYANGVQVSIGSGGNASALVNGNNSFVLDSAGNVVFEGTPSGNAVDRGLVWDYGANANGVNSQIRQDLNGLTVRAWTENGGNYIAPVNIITGQDAATNTWRFDGQGNLTVPSGSINSINDGGDLGSYITLNPNLGLVKLASRDTPANVNYTNTSWISATYTGTQIDFVDAPDLVAFFTNNTFNAGVNQTISINGDEPVPFTGYTVGVSNAVTVYTSVTADPDPTTVTSIDFSSQLESYIAVDYDGGELVIGASGLTIMIDNDQTQGPDINIRSGDDILLQAKDKAIGTESEGGDINIYAGDGADDDGAGNISSTGGDIQITAGNGGDGNSSTGSGGGFTQIYGGTGGAAGVTSTAGSGGYVSINGGDGGYDNGNTQLGAGGGYVSINAGLSTQEGVNGPNVTITSGQGGPNALAGSVVISTPASVDGPGGTWTFDGYGNLTLPNNSNIATIGNVTQFNTCSNGFLGLNSYDAGGNNIASIAINSIDGLVGISTYDPITDSDYHWAFDTTGNLTLPGNTFSVNYANGTPVSIGGGGNTGNVTFDNVTVQGVNGLNLSAGADFTANLAYLQVRAGDVASHIHLDTGNNSAYDLIVGDDQNYVQVSSTGNILLSAYDSNTSQYTWTLDYNGNLILAGGNSVIQSIANSSLDPLNPNVSTMVLTPDPGYSSQALVLDPTSVGHIHLRSPGSNIDQPSANIFLGGETSSFEVGQYNGAVPNLFIHSNNYTWTFDIDGNLTLPGNTFAVNYANGNQVSIGGGGGAAISNGTSYANVVSSDGNVVIGVNNDNMTWTFATDRKIYGLLDEDVQLVAVDDGAGIGVRQVVVDNSLTELSRTRLEETDFFIQFDLDTSANSWRFDSGSLRPPTNGAFEQFDGNIKMYAMDAGSNPVASLQSVSNQNDPNIFSTFDATTSGANISVYNGGSNGGVGYTWRFANDGKLTFPGTPRIDTATNNFEVQAAEAINFEANTVVNIYTDAGNTTYQWQFGDDGNLIIPGTGGGFIKTISNASIGIAAMDNGTNNPAQLLSINAGSGAATSIVSAYSTNATIQTNATGTLNTWQFDNAGNLTLPTGGQIIVSGGLVSSGASPAPTINGFSITNSVGISGNGNIAGNNISATGNVSGNFFIGNGSQLTDITATSLVNGTSNVVTTNNGNVTIGIAGNAAIATFTGTGANVTGTLDVTGNVTAQGVGTNLVRRANTISGSNTVVTLDNLTALVGGSPTRLYIGAATSNMTMAGTSQTMVSGSMAVSSWINLPVSTGVGNGFAVGGAISSAGDTVVLNITDQGAGSGTWRVTGIIANTSANLYSVSIERLA